MREIPRDCAAYDVTEHIRPLLPTNLNLDYKLKVELEWVVDELIHQGFGRVAVDVIAELGESYV